LNARALRELGVSNFEVSGTVPSWEGKKAHPRAYLDAVLDKGIASFRYYERHSPYGDAASRVILKVGSSDKSTVVCFQSGQRMPMAELVERFQAGTL